SVDLLMADYAMTILQPVSALPYTGDPISVYQSPAGRAFGAQQPYVENNNQPGQLTVHLPISVRGDRIGVLTVTLPRDR
ncbi:phosphatase, partial [Streptomyces sp. ASQP_92]|nr:phosphatase [Streptomyces sp. ASQP_92]